MKRLISACFALMLCNQICAAQISIETKSVKTIVKTTPTIVTQIIDEDGTPVSNPTTAIGATVVAEGQPAILMMLTTSRPLEELLIKPRCKTAKVQAVEPGVYLVAEPGKHEIEFNAIGQDPLSWDDTTITIEVDGDSTIPQDEPKVAPNFRLLIVEETGERSSLMAEQRAIFSSPKVRQYLNSKCVKVANQPEWRIWDKDTNVDGFDTPLCNMLHQNRGPELPWLILSNDESSYSGPLPTNVEKFLELVKKYGG